MTSSKNIALGVGLGLGLTGLIFIIMRKKDNLNKVITGFTNYMGGSQFLTGYPRGVRNNNPGNIEMTSTLWKGEITKDQNTDGRFKQFYNYTWGVRAVILNIKSYLGKGYKTPRQIINRWAPPGENNTENYIKYVAKYMGISENSPVSFEKESIRKLVEAIIIKENGKLYLSQGVYDNAWSLA